MTLLALGINHKTACIAMRERITFGPDIVDEALRSLLRQPMVKSCVVLSTCNRTEIYLSVETYYDNIKQQITNWFCEYHNLKEEDVCQSIYWYQDRAVINHLMRVAIGLDSLIVGEAQILGQVKQAFANSRRSNFISNELDRMFQKTFSVAKKIRTETKIGNSSLSVAFAACTIARKIFDSLSEVHLLLIGAGQTIQLVAKHLKKHKLKQLTIANRTHKKAQLLANALNAKVISLAQIHNIISEVDIIISSTDSTNPIITEYMVQNALKRRFNKPMLLIDIAVPRDIASAVGKLNHAYLYNMDDLQMIVNQNLNQKNAAVIHAENIIEKESHEFMMLLKSEHAVDSIRMYRSKANNIRAELEARALSALHHGANPKTVMQELAYKLTNRLIHTPTKSLQKAACDGDNEKLKILRDSLGIE